jgi:hypothetical protein
VAPKNKSLKITMKGIEWTVYAHSTASYKRRHGSDSHAITYTKDREIFFNKDTLAPDYVRHELLHAFVASSSTNSSSLDVDQMEELCAEIIGEHGVELMLYADQILNFFLR